MGRIKYEYKVMIADGAHLFFEKKLTPGMDSGDISFYDREEGYIYICPRPNEYLEITDWSVLRPEDVCVIDIDNKCVEKNGLLPTVESPMHVAIYKARPEVNAIVHGHPLWSSSFAVTGINIPIALAEQALFLGGEVVCAEYGTVGSEELANNIVIALGKTRNAALMRNHGTVAVGKTLRHAFVIADFVEHGAQVVIMGKMLGNIIEVDPDNILDPSLL
jgi:L-ribulose-5-phosphate 4-epimerase